MYIYGFSAGRTQVINKTGSSRTSRTSNRSSDGKDVSTNMLSFVFLSQNGGCEGDLLGLGVLLFCIQTHFN